MAAHCLLYFSLLPMNYRRDGKQSSSYKMKNNQNKILKFIYMFISILLSIKLLFFSYIWSVRSIGEVLGIGGYLFFSLSLFLGSRWKKLEDWIGGLDQVYHLHHQFGVTGFILLILHPLLIATRWLPYRLDKFLLK